METLVQHLHQYSPMFRGGRVPRSELWIATRVFEEMGLADDVRGNLELRQRCGMDILFLPFSEDNPRCSEVDYRFYTLDDIREGVSYGKLPVGVVISGPFQRLVEKMGLTSALLELFRTENVVPRGFQEEASTVRFLIGEALKAGVKIIVVADDIAWEKSLYVSPQALSMLLGPFYSDALSDIHSAGALALFHSCGNPVDLVPNLVSYGFDGLAAWQSNTVDLVGLSSRYEHLTVLAGVEAEVLDTDEAVPTETNRYLEIASSLAKTGNFVLGSSCGIRNGRSLANLRLFYSLVDREDSLI